MKRLIAPAVMSSLILCLAVAPAAMMAADDSSALAKEVSGVARNRTGFCAVVGCPGASGLALELAGGGRWLVDGLEREADVVKAARERAIAAGLYGQVTFEQGRLDALPYADGMVDLLVLGTDAKVAKNAALLKEARRVLAPGACAVVLKSGAEGPSAKEIETALTAAGVSDCAVADSSERFVSISRKRSPTTADWAQWGCGPGQTFISDDKDFRPPNALQWLAGACRGGASLVLCANGRTFYVLPAAVAGITQPAGGAASRQRASGTVLVARDAYNGLSLWRRNYEGNPKTLVAMGDQLLAIVDDQLAALNAATGEVAKTILDKGQTSGIQQLLAIGNTVLVLAKPDTGAAEVQAIDLAKGARLWKCQREGATNVLADDGKAFLCSDKELVCLDLARGTEQWHVDPAGNVLSVKSGVILVTSAKGQPKAVHALSAADGKQLWNYDIALEKGSAGRCDALHADGLVWVEHWLAKGGKGTKWAGLDPKTGQVKKSLDMAEYIPYSCYPTVGTEQYCVLNRPNDLMKWDSGSISEFRAGRNGCSAATVIAGGLYSTVPNYCSCVPGTIRGFTAFGCEDPSAGDASPRLVAGTAKLTSSAPAAGAPKASPSDWPTYRHDDRRSGSIAIDMPSKLEILWDKPAGAPGAPAAPITDEWRFNPLGSEKLTAPVVADGRLYVGLPETHQVVCMNAADGKEVWRFTCEGRLDTPPTIHDGLCLLGTYNGYIYCLRAADGELVWRFRAAPRERLVVAYGQLESRWPVVGGVLVCGDLAYAVCGRSTEIDGGITVYALEPRTGKVVWSCTPTRNIETGFLGVTDLLVSDGRGVSIGGSNHALFDPTTGRHLPQREFYGLRAAVRNFEKDQWLIKFGPEGDQFGYLLGRDRVMGRFGGTQSYQGQDGRLVVFDANNHLVSYYVENVSKARKSTSRIKAMGRGTTEFIDWVIDLPERVSLNAMVGSKNMVFLAARIDSAGGAKHELWGMTRGAGEVVWKQELKEPLVTEGMAAAGGRLYLSTADGRVMCLGAR